MRLAVWALGVVGVLPLLACAHAPVAKQTGVLDRDSEAVVQALAFTVLAAPRVEHFRIDLDDGLATDPVVRRLAERLSCEREGRELRLRRPNRNTQVVAAVRAGRPQWRAADPARGVKSHAVIQTSYQVPGGDPVTCEVHALPLAQDGEWASNSPSGERCWPKPE